MSCRRSTEDEHESGIAVGGPTIPIYPSASAAARLSSSVCFGEGGAHAKWVTSGFGSGAVLGGRLTAAREGPDSGSGWVEVERQRDWESGARWTVVDCGRSRSLAKTTVRGDTRKRATERL